MMVLLTGMYLLVYRNQVLLRIPIMLQVHVESTFNEGMVVSYTDRETGIDYIGALLPKTPQSRLLTRKRK